MHPLWLVVVFMIYNYMIIIYLLHSPTITTHPQSPTCHNFWLLHIFVSGATTGSRRCEELGERIDSPNESQIQFKHWFKLNKHRTRSNLLITDKLFNSNRIKRIITNSKCWTLIYNKYPIDYYGYKRFKPKNCLWNYKQSNVKCTERK